MQASVASTRCGRRKGRKRKRGRQPRSVPRAKQRKLGSGRRAPVATQVPLVTDLSLEPCFKYSLDRVVDGSANVRTWTSYMLKTSTLYVETSTQRLQIARQSPSSKDFDSYHLGEVMSPRRLGKAETIIAGVPLPTSKVKILIRDLDWSEFQWTHTGLSVRKLQFDLRSVRIMSNCSSTYPPVDREHGTDATAVLPKSGGRRKQATAAKRMPQADAATGCELACFLADLASFRSEVVHRRGLMLEPISSKAYGLPVESPLLTRAAAIFGSEVGSSSSQIALGGTASGSGPDGNNGVLWESQADLHARVDRILSAGN